MKAHFDFFARHEEQLQQRDRQPDVHRSIGHHYRPLLSYADSEHRSRRGSSAGWTLIDVLSGLVLGPRCIRWWNKHGRIRSLERLIVVTTGGRFRVDILPRVF